jgi:hypothetical protein
VRSKPVQLLALVAGFSACGNGRAHVDGSTSDALADRMGDGLSDAAVDEPTDVGADANDSSDLAQSFRCIDPWPTAPPTTKVPSLVETPRVLWTIALPSGPIFPLMAALDDAVALTSGYSLLVLDSKGEFVTTVSKPQPTGAISSPLADATGIYFADSLAAYHVDRTGHELWRQPLGTNRATSEFAVPQPPVLDPRSRRLYVSALDGAIWTFAADDGRVISTRPLPGGRIPRVIQMGLSGVLFVDRTGLSTAGAGVPAIGTFSPDDGLWKGELDDGMGWHPENAIAGVDIGIVAFGYLGPTGEERQTVVLDPCGKLRWRVPGNFSWPVAISFADDLIVQDREPTDSGGHTQTIRRFSSAGALVAGPVPTDFLYWPLVGADDALIAVACMGAQTAVVAFDAMLKPLWTVPLSASGCPAATVLGPTGILYVAWAGSSPRVIAVQTTSPGPAPVGWGRYFGGNAGGTFWLPGN